MDIYFSPSNPLGIPTPDLNNLFDYRERTKFHFLKNYWLNKKILIWQSEVLRLTSFSKFDYVMLLGEMYIISSWIVCLIAKIRGKKIYMWSHGLYGNESFIKKHIRLNFLKLADVIFLYENRAKKLLVKNGFDKSTKTRAKRPRFYIRKSYNYTLKLFRFKRNTQNVKQ